MPRMIPQYSTKLFCEIWESANDFVYDYNQLPIGMKVMKADLSTITNLYYLLYSKYGNNPIANYDINQFKYKVFTIIFSKGPTWEKKLDVQKKLRELSEDDLLKGGKAIYNSAQNPSTEPSTGDLEELNYINQQNTTNYKKSKMEGYAQLWSLLNEDVTSKFLNEFKSCFKTFVEPEVHCIYEEEEDEI